MGRLLHILVIIAIMALGFAPTAPSAAQCADRHGIAAGDASAPEGAVPCCPDMLAVGSCQVGCTQSAMTSVTLAARDGSDTGFALRPSAAPPSLHVAPDFEPPRFALLS